MAVEFLVRWRRPRRAVPEPELRTYPESPAAVPEVVAWATHFEKTSNNTSRSLKVTQELNYYPETPAGYYSGYFPGSSLAKSTKSSFSIKQQPLLELNVYPSAAAPVSLPAFIEPPSFKIGFGRRHLVTEELNNYPETPAGYYSGYFPGSALAEGFKVSFKQTRQDLLELDKYPTPLIPATLPAFLEPPSFKHNFTRKLLKVLELNSYPETVAEPPPTVPGLEYTLAENRLQYTLSENRLQYTLPESKLQYTVKE